MTRQLKVFSFGIALLALLAVGSISDRGVFAQDSTATPSTTADDTTITDDSAEIKDSAFDQDKGPFRRFGRSDREGGMRMGGAHKGAGFHVDAETLATFLGMTADELKAEMRTGSSLAEVAEAHGRTRDELKTFLIEQYTAGLDELIDAAPAGQSASGDAVDSIATPEIDATPAASTGTVL